MLQAHLDMVCEKNEGSSHDFSKDPITWVIDGDNLSTGGQTTLGADDGIGVAFAMAVLEDKTLSHPELEILFTVCLLYTSGEINVMLENVPANNYYLQADVYIYTDEETLEMRQVYQSGIIKQGFYVESGEVLEIPEGGRYNGLAVFHALYPETLEEIGQAAMNIVVTAE